MMAQDTTRRGFLKAAGAGALGLALGGAAVHNASAAARKFSISLAGWSLHRTIGTKEGQVPMLDFPKLAADEFGIQTIELVNRMLASTEKAYVDEFIKNAAAKKVRIALIMVDGAGSVGAPSEDARKKAVELHSQWIDIADAMGCHCIRMNWAGHTDETMKSSESLNAHIALSAGPLREICTFADKKGLDVIIENHWGPSSYPDALLGLIQKVDHPRFGTLPDFGNFPDDVDKYDAVDRMMPYAKAVSAKCYDFDAETGQETKLDYERFMQLVVDKHGYHGDIGIEYEGDRLSEFDGIKACKALLERLRG
jgi:sugar phosphate isomerase/epimerase